MTIGIFRRPEFGFITTVGSGMAAHLNVVEGMLQWATLVLGVLIGLLTLVRLLRELGWVRRRRRLRWPRSHRPSLRRPPGTKR